MHQQDAKKRPNLYKRNFINTDNLLVNLAILPNEPQDLDKQQKSVIIPSEEEIMQISSGTQTINNQTQANFTYQQSLTMI